jgi:hypothetical protein
MKRYLVLSAIWLLLVQVSKAEGLLAIDNPAKNGQSALFFVTGDTFQGNDQVAMRRYGGTWQGDYAPRHGTNIGMLFARFEVGAQWQGYRLGILHRGEALVESNRDTSDLVQQYQTSNGYDIGRTYDLSYQLRGFEADGVKIGKSINTSLGTQWQLKSGVGLSYLRGKRLKLETVTGQVVTLNAKDFNAAVKQSTTNTGLDTSSLSEFNAGSAGPLPGFIGQGYALDAGFVLLHRESGIRAELAVADLLGQLDWKNVPGNITDFTTATKYYDANGFVNFDPSTTRTSSYRNIHQTLDPKVHMAAIYPMGNFEFEVSASTTKGYWFTQIGAGYRVNQDWSVQADYDLRFGTVGMRVVHQWLQVAVRADNANLDAAKAYGLAVQINVPF